MPPFAGFMNGCSINIIHMHRLNLAVNPTDYLNKNLLPYYTWETSVSIAAGQAQRKQLYSTEIL